MMKVLFKASKNDVVTNSSQWRKMLSKRNVFFEKLSAATLNRWFRFPGAGKAPAHPIPSKLFHDSMLAGVNVGWYRGGFHGGRRALLHEAEDCVESIVSSLRSIRAAGVCVTLDTARSIVLAHVSEQHPDLLSPHLRDIQQPIDPKRFCISNNWLHHFLQTRLCWTLRRRTKAAQKLPANWEDLRDDALMRIAIVAARKNISADRVYCADETFCFYLPAGRCGTASQF
jgi:hypothetical protein